MEVGDVIIDVLHPPRPDWERPRARNDDSVVLRLRYGRVEMLLTGDIGGAVERTLDPDPRAAPLRILKVAHHGSRSSSTAELIEGYQPVLALVSAGAGNVFGHPAPEVIARLATAHTRVLRTDRDRAVMVETDGREIRVRSWSGVRWRARSWWTSS
jgi:competence protein ComEC